MLQLKYVLTGYPYVSKKSDPQDPEKTWVSKNARSQLTERGPLVRSISIVDGMFVSLGNSSPGHVRLSQKPNFYKKCLENVETPDVSE